MSPPDILSLSSILNLIGTLYEHNIVIFPCFNLICDCILYMVERELHADSTAFSMSVTIYSNELMNSLGLWSWGSKLILTQILM